MTFSEPNRAQRLAALSSRPAAAAVAPSAITKKFWQPPVPDNFHVFHKVPAGDGPYVRAKHAQLVDKDPERAVALFWSAINAGDRVDSALKDMATVMKQQNRAEEAIEAIKSFRDRCSESAQESLDNVLLDLYKRCSRLDDQIALLKHRLSLIQKGMAFNGKRTKTARSQGRKFQASIEQETTRLLGNLGWAYMQQTNYVAAEAVYRKSLQLEPDNNKLCNLGICLMRQAKYQDAKEVLRSVMPIVVDRHGSSESQMKSYERAQEVLKELDMLLSKQRTDSESGAEMDAWQYCFSSEESSFRSDPSSSSSSFSSSSSDGGESCELEDCLISQDARNDNAAATKGSAFHPSANHVAQGRPSILSQWGGDRKEEVPPYLPPARKNASVRSSNSAREQKSQSPIHGLLQYPSPFNGLPEMLDFNPESNKASYFNNYRSADPCIGQRRLRVFQNITVPGNA